MIGDLRFPGGTGAVIAHEIAACCLAGYRCGVINVKAAVLHYPHPINPKIRRLIDDGKVDLLDPEAAFDCVLCLVYHPQTLTHLPLNPFKIRAEIKRLVVNHPCLDGRGKPFYDWTAIVRHAEALLDGEVQWTPVGPMVRRQWPRLTSPPPLADHDWPGIIDSKAWRQEMEAAAVHDRSNGRIVIGRHSRPDPMKWPDTREQLLEIYPADPEIDVKILGGGPFLEELADPMPPHWQVWAFNQLDSQELLRNIDLFIYYHHSQWVEAFGIAILEALAAGCVTLLPPHFEEVFGSAALYATPAEVADEIERLTRSPEIRRRQRAEAIDVVQDRFSYEAHRQRLDGLIGKPACGKAKTFGKAAPYLDKEGGHRSHHGGLPPATSRKRVVFFSSNGIGMGHLTRQLAIARRLDPSIEPLFITMSQAAQHVERLGFPVEYVPFHAYLDCDISRWNHFLQRDLAERLDFYRPAAVVFDGNVPYDGLIRALAARPEIMAIWCRRAMWTPNAGKDHIERERFFDIVIEPGEMAAALDRGLTTNHKDRTRLVDPIQLLDLDELPGRDAAMQELGLDPNRPALLFQLGSRNNFSFGSLLDDVLNWLTARSELQLVWLDWAIAKEETELPPGIKRIRIYPVARYLNAFDYAVSAAGYNAYHELLRSNLPTLFLPNENPMMDDQLSRALFAQQHRLGVCLRRRDTYRFESILAEFIDPAEQQQRRRHCAAIEFLNGAVEAARIVEEAVFSARADRPPSPLARNS
jgi:glycosyltransferase involved in cell wall biosynthesis/UDP:flavonoid glycosyltransferase YjiC (YdhE family)